MGLDEQEGAQKALEKVAVNLLREGIATEVIVRVTGLTPEQVQQLQIQLTQEN